MIEEILLDQTHYLSFQLTFIIIFILECLIKDAKKYRQGVENNKQKEDSE